MAKGTKNSPYLTNEWRLANVVAALQIMGNSPWESRTVIKWEEKLGEPSKDDGWERIFKEHPEFFRLNDQGYASLRWRHGFDRIYDPSQRKELNEQELSSLSDDNKKGLSRKPLSSDQIEALMKTAVEFHSRAIAHAQEKRWIYPLLFGLLGVIIGVVLEAALK